MTERIKDMIPPYGIEVRRFSAALNAYEKEESLHRHEGERIRARLSRGG